MAPKSKPEIQAFVPYKLFLDTPLLSWLVYKGYQRGAKVVSLHPFILKLNESVFLNVTVFLCLGMAVSFAIPWTSYERKEPKVTVIINFHVMSRPVHCTHENLMY